MDIVNPSWQFGFRAVVSTSFADIVQQHSLKNSLLPIVAPADVHAELFAALEANPDVTVKIDPPAQTLSTPGGRGCDLPGRRSELRTIPPGPEQERCESGVVIGKTSILRRRVRLPAVANDVRSGGVSFPAATVHLVRGTVRL